MGLWGRVKSVFKKKTTTKTAPSGTVISSGGLQTKGSAIQQRVNVGKVRVPSTSTPPFSSRGGGRSSSGGGGGASTFTAPKISSTPETRLMTTRSGVKTEAEVYGGSSKPRYSIQKKPSQYVREWEGRTTPTTSERFVEKHTPLNQISSMGVGGMMGRVINPKQKNEPVFTVEVPRKVDTSYSNLFGVGEWSEKKKGELFTKRGRGEWGFISGAKILGVTAIGGFVGTAVGISTAIFHPISTAVGLGTFGTSVIKDPLVKKELIREMGYKIKQEPTAFIGEIAGSYGAINAIGFVGKLGKKGGQTIMKNLPSYEPYGPKFKILPTQTVRTPLKNLKALEGKGVTTTHVTFNPKITYGSLLKEFPEEAGKLRQQIGQYGFFQYPKTGSKIEGLGGYAGLSDDLSGISETKFSLRSPKIKTFVFEKQFIQKTPTAGSAKDLVKLQKKTMGTFIAPENIAKLSTEKQVVTAFGGTTGKETFMITKAESNLGKFTYYPQYKTPPSFMSGGLKQKIWEIFTKENKRINIMPSKLVPAIDETAGIGGLPVKNIVDVGEYSSSYGKVKYISPGSIAKSFVSSTILSSGISLFSPFYSAPISGGSISSSPSYSAPISGGRGSQSKGKVSPSLGSSVGSMGSLGSSVGSMGSLGSGIVGYSPKKAIKTFKPIRMNKLGYIEKSIKRKPLGRPFYRTSSLVVRGLKGTAFELPKIKTPGMFEITGIQTRLNIPGVIKLKKKKRK